VDNVGVGIGLKDLLLLGSLDRAGGRKDEVKFLESSVLGLGDEEVENDGLDDTPDAEDNVGLPGNVLQSDGDTELHDKHSSVGEERAECHTLSSHLVAENLDGVESLERSPADRVEDLEEVDPGQDSLADWGSDSVNLLLVVKIGDVGDGGRDSDTNPAESTDNVDDEKHGTTTDSVSEGGTESGKSDLNSVHSHSDIVLLATVLDTSSVEESAEVIRDNTVTSPLTEKRDETVAGETVEGSTGGEESTVVPPSLVTTVQLKMLLVLVELELDPLTLGVTVTVESGEVLLGKLLLSVGVQPSRRLGEKHGAEANDTREHELKTNGDHPGFVSSLIVPATTNSTASNEGTDGPHDVVETSDDTTVSGVRDFDDVGRTGSGGDGDTETEEEATSHELSDAGVCVAGELNDDTDDDNPSSDCHTGTATPSIDTGSNKRNSDDGTDLIHGGDDTSFDTLVVDTKEFLEVLGREESSEKRTIVTVGSRAAEGDHAGEDEDRSGDLGRGLLDHSLLEGFISNGRLDNDDFMLGVLLVDGVDRHDDNVSALELWTVELSVWLLAWLMVWAGNKTS
jgi:hypothetical protein